MLSAREKGLIHVCDFNDLPVSHLPICSALEPENSGSKTYEGRQNVRWCCCLGLERNSKKKRSAEDSVVLARFHKGRTWEKIKLLLLTEQRPCQEQGRHILMGIPMREPPEYGG